MSAWLVVFNVVATCVWIFQILFAFLAFRKRNNGKSNSIPKLSVIIPAYNESNETVQMVIDSVLAQQNVDLEIFVVDDGSAVPILAKSNPKVSLLRLPTNCGKRAAQIHAIKYVSNDWVVTVDSDTILEHDALIELYLAVLVNRWDAATGHVKLWNEKDNPLTRMIACLYWYGFCQERAAQSYFNNVGCCSGALSIWRKEVIQKISEPYLNQTFCGRNCVAGDDRFLTCLFAWEKKKIGYAAKSIAYTVSPATVPDFVKQQLRWTRSHTPAFIFVLKNIHRISPRFTLFMSLVVFRYSYFAILFLCMSVATLSGNFVVPFLIVLIIVAISGLKATNAFLYTRNWRMLYLVPLSLFSFFILSPIMVYGALTPLSTGWLTRTSKKKG